MPIIPADGAAPAPSNDLTALDEQLLDMLALHVVCDQLREARPEVVSAVRDTLAH